MELDVHLEREGDVAWGFRLIGGKELDMPLTIIEIISNSLAEKIGLQNGDTVSRISGKPTNNLSLDEALLLIDEAEDILNIEVVRGLYDPVIDDQEPVFDEPADFDQQLQPTEVPFKIQNFDGPSKSFGPHYIYDEDGRLVEPNFMGKPGFLDNGEAHYLYATGQGNFENRGTSLEPYSDIIDLNDILSREPRDSRSLTGSPFPLSSKPYRPFSTEPLKEIPPVEDPIILNPEFKDDFGYKFEDGDIESVLKLQTVKSNFKLPKSEKYDPHWEENNKALELKLAESLKINEIMTDKILKTTTNVKEDVGKLTASEVLMEEKKDIFEVEVKTESKKYNISTWELSENFKREVIKAKMKLKEEQMKNKVETEDKIRQNNMNKSVEIKEKQDKKQLIMKTRQQINIDNIEETALNVIDESIHTAEKLVNEVKEEIYNEDIHSESKIETRKQSKTREQNTNQLINICEELKESLQSKDEIREEMTEQLIQSKNLRKESAIDGTKNISKQEFKDEKISAERVNNEKQEAKVPKEKTVWSKDVDSELTERKTDLRTENDTLPKKHIESEKFEQSETNTDENFENIDVKEQIIVTTGQKLYKHSSNEEQEAARGTFSKTQKNNRRKDSEQRVHTVGLQTIPNIRGVVHSQHYELLLQTFFIHLTDVMVALSRFILTKPVLSETLKGDNRYERETRDRVMQESDVNRSKERKGSYVNARTQRKNEYSSKQGRKEISKDYMQRKQQESYIENKLSEADMQENIVEIKKKSGSKMSQKSEDITQKMDNVITEFQNKTEEVRKIRKSSSKSSIEEEVAKESDPLEWLDKINSRSSSQERSFESRRESSLQSRKSQIYQSKSGKKTYRAVVEAHVYTNPDVIFEDHATEILESGSYETDEPSNLAVECNQVVITENIAVKNAVCKETTTAKFDKEHFLENVDVKNQATLQMYEEKLHDVKSLEKIEKKYLEQNATKRDVQSTKDVVIQETREIIEPIIEFEAETKRTKQAKAPKQDILVKTAAESIEITEISEHDIIDAKKFQAEKAKISRDQFNALEVSEVESANSEVIELKLTEDKIAKAKTSLQIADNRALEVCEVAIESNNIKDLQMDIKHEAVAEKAIEEAVAIDISDVNAILDEVTEFESDRQKGFTAKQIFEEATSVAVSEVTVDKHEMTNLNIAKSKEAIATAILEEAQTSVQVSEVNIEKDDVMELNIFKKQSEMANKLYEELSALQVNEVNIEISEQDIPELTIAKNKEFVAEKRIQEASAVQVVDYRIEKDEITELQIKNKKEFIASEATEAGRYKAKVTEVSVNKNLELETADFQVNPMKTEKIQDEFAELNIVKHQEIDAEFVDQLESLVEVTEVSTDLAVSEEFEVRNLRTGISNLKAEAKSGYEISEMNTEIENDYAALNIAKQQILGISQIETVPNSSTDIEKSALYTESTNESNIEINELVDHDETLQESQPKKLVIKSQSEESVARTESPDSVTPLVDEYVFKLEIPLPKGITPVPSDPSPVDNKVFNVEGPKDEDPHIVKKKLVPHIDLSIESAVFDPPLTSPEVRVCSPVYRKPGLRGGDYRPKYRNEEIREIERKSSLLASAIDKTIRSIEEYNEEVGMEAKKEFKIEKFSKSKSINFNGQTVKEVSPIEMNNTFTQKTEVIESQEIKTIPVDVDRPAENLKLINKDVLNETKTELFNDSNTINKSLSKVEKHVDDIKNIVKNVETIANITDNDKTEHTVENIVVQNSPNKEQNNYMKGNDNEVIKIAERANQQIKQKANNTKEILSEITNNHIARDAQSNTTEVIKRQLAFTNEIKGKNFENVDLEVRETLKNIEDKIDPLLAVRPVEFHPENIRSSVSPKNVPILEPPPEVKPYKTETGELLGTIQGIVDGLEEVVIDEEVAKELGKPGLPDEKIAELISGEAEMLREAHVMGLSRVISSHMHRDDDSSVDFKKIKPLVESLKDSEVLKALNEELLRTKEEKKKEERKWTKFLQKPLRPVPKAKGSYPGYIQREVIDEDSYRVKIVKQPKPKVAPDYKPEDFNTGPLPWEERDQIEASLPPPNIVPEEPILIPEEAPEFLEAVDPLPESEVPDLEDTGILLPPPVPEKEIPTQLPEEDTILEVEVNQEKEESQEEEVEGKPNETMDNNLVEQLVSGVQNMVDPNAPLEQQLAQMRAQLAALAELPCVIQQTLELVTKQLFQMSNQQSQKQNEPHYEENQTQEDSNQNYENGDTSQEEVQNNTPVEEIIEPQKQTKPEESQEEIERMKREEAEMNQEQRRTETQKKQQLLQAKPDQESRQLKQRPTPRVGKPKPVFGPLNPEDRPVILPGGRRWRGPKDVYDEEFIRETLTAQAELIQGKVLGFKYESDILPFDERVNFMKYEKPPVSLEHLKNSEVYKLIHNMDESPLKRVEMRTPVIAEADYREVVRPRYRWKDVVEAYLRKLQASDRRVTARDWEF